MCFRGFVLVLIFAYICHCQADLEDLPGHMILGNGKFPNRKPNVTKSGLSRLKERNHGGDVKNDRSPTLQALLGGKQSGDDKPVRVSTLGERNNYGVKEVKEYALPDLRMFPDFDTNSIHKHKEKVKHGEHEKHGKHEKHGEHEKHEKYGEHEKHGKHKKHGEHEKHGKRGSETGADGGKIIDSVLEVMDAVLRKTQQKVKELLDREMRSREAMGKPPPKKQPILNVIPFLKRIQRMHRTPTGLPDPASAISTIIGVIKDASAAAGLREHRSMGSRRPKDDLEAIRAAKGLKAEDLKALENLLNPGSGKCGCQQWEASNEGKKRKGRSEEDRPEGRPKTRNELLRSVGSRTSELTLDALDQVSSRIYRMAVGFLA